MLDHMEGAADPQDGDRPENWLASLVTARNPGLEIREGEGLSLVETGGTRVRLQDLIAADPEGYLGPAHVAAYGQDLGFLAKLLDSSMRLHIQAHPTRRFAREQYGKSWGKFEAYVILAARNGIDAYILLGFQHPPTPEEWLRIVVEQDRAAMEACFEKVPVKPGEVWFVPGGLPHALGEGLLVLEVMEPSDLVVRCEFEREGIVVPEAARFMGLNPKEALRIFDYTPWPLEALRDTYRVEPRPLRQGKHWQEWLLIGHEQIDCFEVRNVVVDAKTFLPMDHRFAVGFVQNGIGGVKADGRSVTLKPGACFWVSACCSELSVAPAPGETLRMIFCFPGDRGKFPAQPLPPADH